MEFEEVRAYVPGDDVRHIDWNVTARTTQPFVKVFREERQMTVQLVVDVSGSTRLGSGGRDGVTDRRRQITRIAGGLAYAGIRSRDRVGLTTFTDRIETHLTPGVRRGHVWAVIQAVFEARGQHRGTDLSAALGFVASTQRRRAVVVVISDFIDSGDWSKDLARLARRHDVHAVLVHDPLDVDLLGLGLVEMVDAESGRTFLADGAAWSNEHSVAERMSMLLRAGTRAVSISTGDDPYAVLARHFHRSEGRR